jgi:hypothetical protein
MGSRGCVMSDERGSDAIVVITEITPRGSRRALALAEETRARRKEDSHFGYARRESGYWLALLDYSFLI